MFLRKGQYGIFWPISHLRTYRWFRYCLVYKYGSAESFTLHPIGTQLYRVLLSRSSKNTAHHTPSQFIPSLNDNEIIVTMLMKGPGCNDTS